MSSRTIVFDVNETLLDLSALDPLFADAFGDKSVRRIWFAQTLQNAMLASTFGRYRDFTEIARASLEMTAKKRGVAIDAERVRRIVRGMTSLPAHGDVRDGLAALQAAGHRIVALTNGTLESARAQLEYARLRPFFDALLSADAVRAFKPAPEVYAMAERELGAEPASLVLVAAHDWDVLGAGLRGWETAFVARHGTALNPLDPAPTYAGPDLRAIAGKIALAEAA